MKTAVIIVAAGKSKRVGLKIEKQFVKIKNIPVLIRAIAPFQNLSEVDYILILTLQKKIEYCKQFIDDWGKNKVLDIIEGGRTRQNTVYNGLKYLVENKKLKDEDIVLIHDAARPYVKETLIKKIIYNTKKYGAAIPGVPVIDTIKMCDKNLFVEKTLPREKLWAIQTPQGFRLGIIWNAFKKASVQKYYLTDDSALVEKLKIPVKLVQGDFTNIKITTKEQLK